MFSQLVNRCKKHYPHAPIEDIDRAVSNYFADTMKERMSLKDEMVQTFYLGVDAEDYNYIPVEKKPRNLGYISRMCHENGFDIVVDAFILLKKDPDFHDVKCIATGGATGDDAKFIREQRRKIKINNLENDFVILHEFEDEARHDFFKQVSMVSVPVRIGEAFGMYLLESMASGVPVVQPHLGAFPEIIETSGGGITYKPNSPEALKESWAGLLRDTDRMKELSSSAVNGVREKFNIHKHALEIVELYEGLVEEKINT